MEHIFETIVQYATTNEFFSKLSDFDTISVLLVVLFLLNILVGLFFYLFCDTLIHESCHAIALKFFAKRNRMFKGNVICKIQTNKKNRAFIKSNYYSFLKSNRVEYKNEIKIIALSGFLLSFLLYTVLFILFLFLTLFVHYYFFAMTTFFIIPIIGSTITFFFSKNQEEKNGIIIKQSDKFLVKHPDKFENVHPIHKKKKRKNRRWH